MADQTPQLDWRDNRVPVSKRFDDLYFSTSDGFAETQHVFLAGNRIPERFEPGFHIAELGFGTGLNMFASLAAWRQAGVTGPLRFTSFEAFPMQADDMARALGFFPELGDIAVSFLELYSTGSRAIRTEDLIANIVVGDARDLVPKWKEQADAWFLDGFSPAKNPELWEAGLLIEIGKHTKPGGSFATYSAAGAVRAALSEAGFLVGRQPGFGQKKHMTTGWLKVST